MNERSPSRLELLEFGERVAMHHLEQVRRWKADELLLQAEREQGEAASSPRPE
ncbi:hypothetical protein [Streptomyces sp. NPDC087300]|uniref:hypothetical protein n=1 Tax=Streptomyces sp. NPDC087300 TaxID=3365780 RepID=UPI0037FB50FD